MGSHMNLQGMGPGMGQDMERGDMDMFSDCDMDDMRGRRSRSDMRRGYPLRRGRRSSGSRGNSCQTSFTLQVSDRCRRWNDA